MKLFLITSLLLVTTTINSASINKIDVLSLPDISGWEKKIFSGETSYEPVSIDNRHVLKASSNTSASGLVRVKEVDFNKTHFMYW